MGFDMDRITLLGVKAACGMSTWGKVAKYHSGDKLKILLVGYNGKRNTGADVRVVEMVKQFYKILGKNQIEIGILTLNKENIEVYFESETLLIPFSSIFFKDLAKACKNYHMAVLSEGSCLKSKFANALTLFFCEAAGIMKKQGKPCIAYGSEAGYMDPYIEKAAIKMCSDTYFIGRTEPSLQIIRKLGLSGTLGTDTAWTFKPAAKKWVEEELKTKAGWDGKKPILGISVINPYAWPVKPSLLKLFNKTVLRRPQEHYEKWYFFSSSPERTEKYNHYLESIAKAVNRFVKKIEVHVVLIGMEALDIGPCTKLSEMLDQKPQFFSSKYYDGFQMAGILHALSYLVTSRYHARVLSMTGGIPSIAVSMDERLYNLFQESNHLEDYYLTTDDKALEEKLFTALNKLAKNKEKVSEEILATLPNYLKMMAQMGKIFKEFVQKHFPDFPLPKEPKNWQGYLPELAPGLKKLLKDSPANE